jgi:hypothetical protein
MSDPSQKLDLKPQLPELTPRQRAYCQTLLKRLKVGGKPASECLTEGQFVIFAALVLRLSPRIEILCSTQYGKSMVVAMACVVLTCILGLDVVVVAPTGEKAAIIMRYYIEHIGDHPLFASKLEKNSRLERLRQEESKKRIKLNNGGSIFVVSTDEKNSAKSIESAMGQGGTVTILDEACLTSDKTEATVFRMIAGKPDHCYVKIGNPFYSAAPYSHFHDSWVSTSYLHIFIDYVRALAEGRYTQPFIDEAKRKPLFDVMFGCEFPPTDVMDGDGYRPLVTAEQMTYGITLDALLLAVSKTSKDGPLPYPPKLGVDCGGGGDSTTCTMRWGKLAAKVAKVKTKDTMQIPVLVQEWAETCGVKPEDVNIDDIGLGRGASDRLKEMGFALNSVNVGDPAMFDPETFTNLRAELCWAVRTWVLDGGTLDRDDDWGQAALIRYKTLSDRKLQIEPKDRLRARVGYSPDMFDSLMLTFAECPFVGFV